MVNSEFANGIWTLDEVTQPNVRPRLVESGTTAVRLDCEIPSVHLTLVSRV